MQNIAINNASNIITFNTTKKGGADLKKDGGTHRGRHKVQVEVLVGTDHKTIAALDLIRIKGCEESLLRQQVAEKVGEFTNDDWEDALRGTQPRKKGLIISLQQSAVGDNPEDKHLDAYEAHPCGVSGVVVHKTTGEVHIRGIVVSEKIIEADPMGDARKVENGLHVKIKNTISKTLGLTTGKWRQYSLPSDVVISKTTI